MGAAELIALIPINTLSNLMTLGVKSCGAKLAQATQGTLQTTSRKARPVGHVGRFIMATYVVGGDGARRGRAEGEATTYI